MNKKISLTFSKNSNFIACMAIIFSLILLTLPPILYEMVSDLKLPNINALTPHAPIYILQDGDFMDFPGAGTPGNPYRIEGYNITTTEYAGIMISDVGGITQHFIIKNCYLDADQYGIDIDTISAGLGRIENVTCANNVYHGINAVACTSLEIENCSIYNNYRGINVQGCPNIKIRFNEVYENTIDGIDVNNNADDAIIANNTCYLNRNGISIARSRRSCPHARPRRETSQWATTPAVHRL